MAIPNVYMSWCKRRAKCHFCPEMVEAGTPMVNVFLWRKGEDGVRKWNMKFYYHPQCWLDQGLDYLKMNPYVPYKRDRQLPLTERQQDIRRSILRRKASIEQRRRNLKSDYPDRILVEARMDKDIAELMVKIIKVGGIPPKWLS